MKKQTLAIIYLLIITAGALLNTYSQPLGAQQASAEEQNGPKVIPEEAIRLRILANSDAPEDQAVKLKIRDQVNKQITQWVKDIDSIEKARALIRSELGEINKIAKETMKKEGMNQSIKVEYGTSVRFPTKLYGDFIYPAGDYEAILITLGNGEGANWWCVLFPPLCFLDFSTGQAVEAQNKEVKQEVKAVEKSEKVASGQNKKEEVEVKFFLAEWFSGLFS
ncbi:stage II sporulation protein R [Bacillus sp. FJAT-42376]|uniref:stage II sporulation protein R n=1 Tax=Bacillus sp. FJAT-42376 TaxID=2014076 RepID=UPI000F50F8A0|nr:stage II sporulation protein R [Bacillus sp. FJAT-42376]AZB40917.1 stage II sporulation protein R [Bacillus sp. FJAT-42376]